jgi:hypothetical protein
MLSFHPGLTGNYNNLLNPQKHLLQVRQDSVVTMILCVHVHAQLLSHVWLWPHGLLPIRLLCQWNFPSKNTGASCNFLLQGIFPTQGSKLCLLDCREILTTAPPGKPWYSITADQMDWDTLSYLSSKKTPSIDTLANTLLRLPFCSPSLSHYPVFFHSSDHQLLLSYFWILFVYIFTVYFIFS